MVIMALVLPAAPATADILTLHWCGTFGPTSTLGGVSFGAPTPFTFQATFDSTTDTAGAGLGVFDTVVTFSILGFGTFTSDPAGDVGVRLVDPSFPGGTYGAGLANTSTFAGFAGSFNTATPPFDADAPVPSVLTDFTGPEGNLPLTIPLMGGAGDLVINNIDSFRETAQITAAVPAPGALALLGLGLLGLGTVQVWRRR